MKYVNLTFLGMIIFSLLVAMVVGASQVESTVSPFQHVVIIAGIMLVPTALFGIFGLGALIYSGKLNITRSLQTVRGWAMRNRRGLISGAVTMAVPLLLVAWMFQQNWTGSSNSGQALLLSGTIFLSILSVAAGWIVGTDQSPVKLDWGFNKSGLQLHWRWYKGEPVRAD